uniref:Phosphatase and actin regulator n=1 Tax=Xiphophorus couchianus TaxID=32473 RepID=A0A3B5KNY2_9TELE
MPPPAAFHEQRRSLERARTEDYLKRKIRSRPERSELVRMHILEETSAEPSLQAKQLKLKRARLADDLNDKISHRPGPIELVHKNILSTFLHHHVIMLFPHQKHSWSFALIFLFMFEKFFHLHGNCAKCLGGPSPAF